MKNPPVRSGQVYEVSLAFSGGRALFHVERVALSPANVATAYGYFGSGKRTASTRNAEIPVRTLRFGCRGARLISENGETVSKEAR